MKDLTVSLEDVPGSLAALGEEGAPRQRTRVRSPISLVEDGDRARNVLEAAGFKIEGDDDAIVLYIPGEDRPGTIGRGLGRSRIRE